VAGQWQIRGTSVVSQGKSLADQWQNRRAPGERIDRPLPCLLICHVHFHVCTRLKLHHTCIYHITFRSAWIARSRGGSKAKALCERIAVVQSHVRNDEMDILAHASGVWSPDLTRKGR
jgi:hypothetical protein